MSGEVRGIHDLIDHWYDAPEEEVGRSLHEYLGLTWEEYCAWMNDRVLPVGCGLRDGDIPAASAPVRDRERWPDRKRVQRMARAELARLHGEEYRRLLAKYGRKLQALRDAEECP